MLICSSWLFPVLNAVTPITTLSPVHGREKTLSRCWLSLSSVFSHPDFFLTRMPCYVAELRLTTCNFSQMVRRYWSIFLLQNMCFFFIHYLMIGNDMFTVFLFNLHICAGYLLFKSLYIHQEEKISVH